MKKASVILLFLSLSLCNLTRAEEFQLNNETRITGTLVGVNGDLLLVKTPYGEIKIPRADVISITFRQSGNTGDADSGSANVPRKIEESLDGVTYTNRTGLFQITVENGWILAPQLREKNKDIVAALESGDRTLFFLVTPEPFSGTLNTYKVLSETQFENNFRDYKKLTEFEAKLDGRDGLRLTFEGFTKDSNTKLKFLVYIVPYEGRVVRLSFFTLAPLFDDAIPTFEKIAKTYRELADKSIASENRSVLLGSDR